MMFLKGAGGLIKNLFPIDKYYLSLPPSRDRRHEELLLGVSLKYILGDQIEQLIETYFPKRQTPKYLSDVIEIKNNSIM